MRGLREAAKFGPFGGIDREWNTISAFGATTPGPQPQPQNEPVKLPSRRRCTHALLSYARGAMSTPMRRSMPWIATRTSRRVWSVLM
jgi:hypothetical protein